MARISSSLIGSSSMGAFGDTASDGIAYRLKQMNDGGELFLRQHIEQRVGLLAFLGDIGSQ